MVLSSSQMLLATRWTDLKVHEVCFVMKTIEIKKHIKNIKWQDEKMEWEL
jgi:hypothetical protein